MLLFSLCAALMLAAALAFVLPPLLRAPADPQQRARAALEAAHAAGVLDARELERKLAKLPNTPVPRPSRAFALLCALVLALAAVGLYRQLGEPRALDPTLRAAAPTPASSDSAGAAPSMDQAVAGLAERLRQQPDDLDGWLLLGRAYKTMERFGPAREALANAIRLAPESADVMVEYAEALALDTPSRRIEGEARTLIDRALAAEPQHQRALWLLGIAKLQAGQPAEAVADWERLRALLSDEKAIASLQQQIDDARRSAGMPVETTTSTAAAATPPATAPAANTAAPTGGPQLTIQVDIAPELRSQVGASDVLFVFARAVEGPRMPLAIQRLPAGRLPTTVTLDDSSSMLPTLKLSSLTQVVVGARISKSGQATPQSGDLQVLSAPVATTQRDPLQLTINEVVP